MDAVLIRKSTGEIIKRDQYPRIDFEPVVGLDPDLEWLLIFQPYDEPAYDSRLFILSQDVPNFDPRIGTVTFAPHPDHPAINQYPVTFSLDKRPLNDITLSIQQAEQLANVSVMPADEQLKSTILALATIIKKQDGLTLNPDEKATIDNLMSIAESFWKNAATSQSKIADVIAGNQPDIDSSWENAKSILG
jgi:hypothetical protein